MNHLVLIEVFTNYHSRTLLWTSPVPIITLSSNRLIYISVATEVQVYKSKHPVDLRIVVQLFLTDERTCTYTSLSSPRDIVPSSGGDPLRHDLNNS